MKRTMIALSAFCIMLCGAVEAQELHPPMRLSREAKGRLIRSHESAPRAYIDPAVRPFRGSMNLLDYLSYVPDERDQGFCGNCWVWAGTGILEIALNVQRNIKDRLSIQYMNSCGTNGDGQYCCCGGWLEDVVSFYALHRGLIPWSNSNASYADHSSSCSSGQSAVACSSIAASPDYEISSVSKETIETYYVGQDAAIENIKNVLNQKRAVWFAFFVSNSADWDVFSDFWSNQPETALFNFDYSCNKTPDSGGVGHAVLCVGYNDDDPANRYWIILNSWGTTSGRPTGLFRVSMDLDYDCSDLTPAHTLYWETLNVNTNPPPTPTPPAPPWPPGLIVTLNKNSFTPGDPLTVHVSLDDSYMDFYLYLLAVSERGGTYSILHGGRIEKGSHPFYPYALGEIHSGFAANIVSLRVPDVAGNFTLKAATIPDQLPQNEANARGRYGHYTEVKFDVQR